MRHTAYDTDAYGTKIYEYLKMPLTKGVSRVVFPVRLQLALKTDLKVLYLIRK
jgi:hypothetical protein